MWHPHPQLALPPRHCHTQRRRHTAVAAVYLRLISPIRSSSSTSSSASYPLTPSVRSQPGRQRRARPAGLNVAREALLKAQGPISLVQMHGPHQTFMQIAMFYLNNYEVIHRKRLFSLFFLPVSSHQTRLSRHVQGRRRAAAAVAALPTLETSLAAIFILVPVVSLFIECDRKAHGLLFRPGRCCSAYLLHMDYMCTCGLRGL